MNTCTPNIKDSYTYEDLLASGRGELFGKEGPQLPGFFLGWVGGKGKGRALGVGEVKFTGQILPSAKKVVYRINMKRVINRKLVMGMADGEVEVDGRVIYTATDLKVGLFQDTSSF